MSKNAKMTNPMKVITGPNTRWSYANVWEPKSINGGTPKYSVSLIIPKSDTKTVAKIEAAIEAAYREGEAKLKGNGKSVPALSVLKTPLRDGDLERPDDPAYAGSYFVNANATSAPGIVDADRNPILTRSEVYSGVYGRASISFYAFNSSGNKGIACGLNNLQKIRDGEPLGGNEFAEILNLFIANVIAYTFFVAVYGFIIYNVGKIILYLIRYAVYHIRRDINKYKSNKDKQ